MMAENFFVISVHHQEKTFLQLIIIMISYKKKINALIFSQILLTVVIL